MSQLHFGHDIYDSGWVSDTLNESAQIVLSQHQHAKAWCDCHQGKTPVRVRRCGRKWRLDTEPSHHADTCPLHYEPNLQTTEMTLQRGMKRSRKVGGFLPSYADVRSLSIDSPDQKNTVDDLLKQLWHQAKLTHHYLGRPHMVSWNTLSKQIMDSLDASPIIIDGKPVSELLTLLAPHRCFYHNEPCPDVPLMATYTQAAIVLGELEDLAPIDIKYPMGDYAMRLKFMGRKQSIHLSRSVLNYLIERYTSAFTAIQTKQPFKFVVLAKVYKRKPKYKSNKHPTLTVDDMSIMMTDDRYLPVQTMDELKQIKFSLNLHKKPLIKPTTGALVRLDRYASPKRVPIAQSKLPLKVSLNQMMTLAANVGNQQS